MGARWQCPSSPDPGRCGAEPEHGPGRGMKAAPRHPASADRCGVAVSPSTGSPWHRQQLCPQAVARFLAAGRTCEIASGERRNGSAGMSRTEGTDGPRPSGNGALFGPFPPRCRQGFAFGSGAAAGERQEMGSEDEPPATAIATSGQPCGIPLCCGQQGLFLGRRGLGIRFSVWITQPALTGAPFWH